MGDPGDTFIYKEDEEGWRHYAPLAEQRKTGQFCDVDLESTGEDGSQNVEIPAHKCVLAAKCEYFKTMFGNPGVAEANQRKVAIKMRDTVLLAIVIYLYTGVFSIGSEMVRDVVDAANYFLLDSLKESAGQFLVSTLTAHNCLELLTLADRYSLASLKTAAHKQAAVSPSFLLISAEDLMDLIKSDSLRVSQESLVLEAVLLWARSEDGRKDELPNLLSAFRLPFVRPAHLLKIVSEEGDATTRQHLAAAPQIASVGSCGGWKPRPSFHSSFRIPWRVSGKEWTDAPDMLQKRKWFSAASIGDTLYAIGGDNGIEEDRKKSNLSVVEMLSTDAHRPAWRIVAPLPKARICHGAATVRDQIYVNGGIIEGIYCSSVAVYDSRRDEWRDGPAMLENRCESLTSFEGILYTAGTPELEKKSQSGEFLDTRTATWQALPPMLVGRCRLQMVGIDGKIYAIGDCKGDDSTVEYYDVRAGKWCLETAEVPKGVKSIFAALCDGKVAIAGEFEKGFTQIKILDGGSWIDGPKMAVRHQGSLCAVDQTVFYMGGVSDGEVTSAVSCLGLSLEDSLE